MCSEQEIVTLVKLAQKQEVVNPQEAAASYLQAAKLLLEQSEAHPQKEEEYISIANKLYVKAKKLQSPASPKVLAKADNTITFAEIGGLDELKALGGDRSDALAYERSAVAQLLTEMDGVDAKGQQLLLLAATNEPWSIDPALRREGRLGSTIFIPPPDQE